MSLNELIRFAKMHDIHLRYIYICKELIYEYRSNVGG